MVLRGEVINSDIEKCSKRVKEVGEGWQSKDETSEDTSAIHSGKNLLMIYSILLSSS